MDRVKSNKLVIRALPLAIFGALANVQQTAAQEGAAVVLDEIVVTAQKRSQSISDVPIAISAFTGDDLEAAGVGTLTQLTDFSPSISFETGQSFQNNSLKIRGVGTFGNGRTFEGAVGVFVDGVYRSRGGMVLGDLLDVAGLEILRGPQGTLFGKNTVAGALNLSSVAPNVSEREGNISISAGTENDRVISGAINFPLSDVSALRVSGVYHERDGFYETSVGEDLNDIDRFSLKANYLYEPSEGKSLQVIVDLNESDSGCCFGAVYTDAGPLVGALGPVFAGLAGLPFVPNGEESRSNDINNESREDVSDFGVSAKINYPINDNWSVESITAFRSFDVDQIDSDFDFGPIDLFTGGEPTEIDNFSQEISFSGTIGAATDTVIGLFYATEDFESTRTVAPGSQIDEFVNILISGASGLTNCFPSLGLLDCVVPPGALVPDPSVPFTIEDFQQDSDSFAAYVHTITPLNNRLDLVAGLRYGIEDKEGGFVNTFRSDSLTARALAGAAVGLPPSAIPAPFNALNLLGGPPGVTFSASTDDEEFAGTLSLQYAVNDNVNTYITASRGYKAGGVNLLQEAFVIDNTTYEPETADSIELGLKATFWGGRASSNIAIFRTEFSDFQINFFTGLAFFTDNAEELISQGVEAEGKFQLSEGWSLDYAASFLDTEFTIETPGLEFLNGRDAPKAPSFSASLAVNYERSLSANMALYSRVGGKYTGDHFVGADVATETEIDGYVVYSANIGIRNESAGWDVSAYCQNCGDETYRTIFFTSPVQPGSFSTLLNTPRYVGLIYRQSF